MTSRERVRAALRFELPDRAPTDMRPVHLTDAERAFFDQKYGSGFTDSHGQDLIELTPILPYPESPFDTVNGVVWYRDPILSDDYHELDELVFPDPDDPALYDEVRAVRKARPDIAIAFDIGIGLNLLHGMRLMENIYGDVYENPEGLARALDKIWNVQRRVLENALKLDIDAIYLHEEIASQKALLFSPRTLEKITLPHLAEGAAMVKAAGLPALFHSDGNVTEILPRLAEIGISAVNPMQPACNDLAEYARLYGGRMALYGGIDNTGVLRLGTPDDVRRHVRDLFELAGRGGLILATHMIDPATPRANLVALWEAAATCEYV